MSEIIPGVKDSEWLFIKKHLVRLVGEGTKVYLYGSRYRGDHRQYSDLDMSLERGRKIEPSTLDSLEQTFSDSDIPYKIDLSDFSSLDKEFQEHIQKNSKFFVL